MTGPSDAKPMGSLVYNGKTPIIQVVPLMTWTTNVQTNLGGFVAPCKLRLEEVIIRVLTASDDAGALLNLGADSDIDAIMADFSLDAIVAGVYRLFPDNAAFDAQRDPPYADAGEYVFWNMEDAGDTATGNFSLTAIWTPWWP